jgi:hypothetical protein
MNKKSKLSLYLQVNEIDGELCFEVEPAGQKRLVDDLQLYEFEIEAKQRNQIKINLQSKQGHQSHIIVKEIRLNDQIINHLDLSSRYLVHESKQTESTYGYMGKPGIMFLNIHQNALVHNYMTYFLSRCKNNKS